MISAIAIPRPSATPATSRPRAATLALRELALMAGLFVLYRQIRLLSRDDTDAALDNADRVVAWERHLGVFSERSVQRAALHAHPIIDVLDHYYVFVHFPLTFTFIGWLWWRRRPAYAAIRNWFVGVTAVALVVHVAFPLAPPRMLDGFVDTLAVRGPNIYSSDPHESVANQFAAMPSLHFGWALMVAIGWVLTHRGRARHLAWAHPLITLLAIVATANHYWADAAVAGVIVLAVGAVVVGRRERAGRSDDGVEVEPNGGEVDPTTSRRCLDRHRLPRSSRRPCERTGSRS